MACNTSIIRLMVLALYFSCIIYIIGATPVTRTASIFQKSSTDEVADSRVLEMENRGDELWKKESNRLMMRRMEMQLNDYPGSGANNRHTPRSQFGRGCVDC